MAGNLAIRHSDVQLPWGLGKTPVRRAVALRPQEIHPVVRIAHHVRSTLRIGPRIILDHELVLIVRGSGRLITESQAIAFGPHHLFFIEPFVPHAFQSEGAVEHMAVHFDFAPGVPASSTRLRDRRAYQVRITQDLAIPRHLVLEGGDPVERALGEIIASRARAGDLAALAAGSHLLRVLVMLLEYQAEKRMPPPAAHAGDHFRLQRALAFLEEHLSEKLSAADLADAAETSPSHFNRLFRRWSGTSPMEFLRKRRIEEARRLLARPELSIKQVAGRTGFDDPYHFSRVFRQVDGLSPSQFRAAALASEAIAHPP